MPRRRVAVHVTDDRAALLPGSEWWAYVRVSLGEKQDIRSQQRAVQEFADKHALVIARWWIDDHVSGSSVEGRDAFDGMIEACRKERSQCAGILVWNLARWARNDLESQYYRADLRLHGYAVVSVSDDIPSGDLGLIMEALLDFKNRKYLEDLSKDTKRGLRDTVLREIEIGGEKRTGFSGGGFPPRGYRAASVVTGHRRNGEPRVNAYWQIDPVWQERVTRARQMYAEGVPVKSIHEACGIFKGLSGYKTFWPCTTYAGVRRCGDVVVLGAHPAYDDATQRAKIDARVAEESHRVAVKRTKVAHMLVGLVHCGYCGAPLHGHAHVKGDHYYCAQSHRAESPCKARRVLCRVLDHAVLDYLRANVWTPDGIAKMVEAVNAGRASGQSDQQREESKIGKEQARLARQITNLVAALAEGDAPRSILGRIKELEAKQAANEARLRRLALEAREAAPLLFTNAQIKDALDELYLILDGEDRAALWRFVRPWVARVEVFEDGATITPACALAQYRITQYPQPDLERSGTVLFGKRYRRRSA